MSRRLQRVVEFMRMRHGWVGGGRSLLSTIDTVNRTSGAGIPGDDGELAVAVDESTAESRSVGTDASWCRFAQLVLADLAWSVHRSVPVVDDSRFHLLAKSPLHTCS